ncbi:hypothetical protein Kpho01_68820 [Kitasatospora phosalacinea]|uniref:Uncharacterized protein n=1 Tax=Kitasatospora phosalacinea TaxID=2065 RepID=A0A9W6UT78_9ACTN|nr:hypothetical protein Kpho01_68820 [Kitasatospora phosalacinea]
MIHCSSVTSTSSCSSATDQLPTESRQLSANRKEIEAQAVTAAYLATTLVQWFASGAIRRA